MTFWTPDSIRSAVGGQWLVRPGQIELPKDRPADLPLPPLHAPITGVSTDTRTLKAGQMFIALRGENHDGHAHARTAASLGAPIIMIDDPACVPTGGFEEAPACGVLKVADTAKALLKLAQAYRRSLERTKVIAVCGSNGKTTTTRLIDQVLGKSMRGSASIKSFNNSIGVPLTLLAAKENDQYVVCEIGTNAPGEIALLGEVAWPDIAVITSIGREHLEGLGDLAGVAKEESAILRSIKPGGWAIVTGDSPELAEHLKGVKNVLTFGKSKDAMLRLTSVKHVVQDGRAKLHMEVNGRVPVVLPIVGEHNALNALAALSVARRLGIDELKAAAALATAGGAEMRLEISTIAGVTIINDAYNANPDSMLAALNTHEALVSAGLGTQVSGAPGAGRGRPVVVLGEMLELGESSAECHRLIADALVKGVLRPGSGGVCVLVGAGMSVAYDRLVELGVEPGRATHLPACDEAAAAWIARSFAPGDLVLVKGSRRVGLERVVKALKHLAESGTARATTAGPAIATTDIAGSGGLGRGQELAIEGARV